MPVAEGFRTWVRCPPPPPFQPSRTALRGLDEIEDLKGGLGFADGPARSPSPTSARPPLSRRRPPRSIRASRWHSAKARTSSVSLTRASTSSRRASAVEVESAASRSSARPIVHRNTLVDLSELRSRDATPRQGVARRSENPYWRQVATASSASRTGSLVQEGRMTVRAWFY